MSVYCVLLADGVAMEVHVVSVFSFREMVMPLAVPWPDQLSVMLGGAEETVAVSRTDSFCEAVCALRPSAQTMPARARM